MTRDEEMRLALEAVQKRMKLVARWDSDDFALSKHIEAALREPGETWLALPDSEGWWWERRETQWCLIAVLKSLGGSPFFRRDAGYKHVENVRCQPGRWVKANPPTIPTPAGESPTPEELADLAQIRRDDSARPTIEPKGIQERSPAASPHILDFFTGPAKAAMQEMITPAQASVSLAATKGTP